MRPDSRAWLWSGTRFEPCSGLPPADRGFRYGMSVFESFPVVNGVAVMLGEHLARLRESCARVEFVLPEGALDVCAGALAEAGNGFGRIYITAGDGGVTAACDACRVLILVEKREPVPARVYQRGYDLALHAAGFAPAMPGMKTGNYWANIAALREGAAASRDETLLLTPAGHLVSACMANVFATIDGQLVTPDPATGVRGGVVREWVMSRQPARETLLTRAEIERADEVFLTSSWLGVMPATSLDGRPLESRALANQLMAEYRAQFSV